MSRRAANAARRREVVQAGLERNIVSHLAVVFVANHWGAQLSIFRQTVQDTQGGIDEDLFDQVGDALNFEFFDDLRIQVFHSYPPGGSEQFGGRQAHMLGADGHGFFFCRNDQGPAGEVVGFSQKPPGALVDGGDGGVIEEVAGNPCDGQVVLEVELHLLSVEAFEVAAGDDA